MIYSPTQTGTCFSIITEFTVMFRYDVILLKPSVNSTLNLSSRPASEMKRRPRRSCPNDLKFNKVDHYIEV